ncbi:MAG: riboflavin biosynthesis protein RibD [Pseudonocardiales bacterium]|nr:MAG: riboflavin biosynthesis protein RibD [Pseudonocardiales bacterium]
MGRLIVTSFTTLDGVVEDPDGSDGTPFGGWAMRHGPQGVAGDKFRLGPILEHGTLLFGRRTWDHFRTLWPRRDDPFSQAMNAATKAVVTHRPVDETEWAHSRAIDAPLAQWVRREVVTTDIAVIGSMSVVAELADQGLVQEFRLLVFPTVLGAGHGLFRGRRELTLVSSENVGPAVLAVLTTDDPPERS